jgi:hypothetical protein
MIELHRAEQPRTWAQWLALAALVLVTAAMTSSTALPLSSAGELTAQTSVGTSATNLDHGTLLAPGGTVRSVLQPRIVGLTVIGLVVLATWLLGAGVFGHARTRAVPRAAPGRRGRALLHAYLN